MKKTSGSELEGGGGGWEIAEERNGIVLQVGIHRYWYSLFIRIRLLNMLKTTVS
jgi:hypothetical protein